MDIREEIINHIKASGENAYQLSLRAGVSPSIISKLLAKKQNDLTATNYLKIKAALEADSHCAKSPGEPSIQK